MLHRDMKRDVETRLNPYLVQKIMTASPEELVAYMYDVAIAACNRKDKVKACEVVQQLINALNFEYKEASTTFYRMYSYILDQIHKNKFGEARNMLSELRQTWCKAMKISS